MRPPSLRVHIANLVIHRLPPRDRMAFAAALQAEIARQLDGSQSDRATGARPDGVQQAAAATVRAVREALHPGTRHG